MFEIGERVKYVGSFHALYGSKGTVIDKEGTYIRVEYDSAVQRTTVWCSEPNELRRLEVKTHMPEWF